MSWLLTLPLWAQPPGGIAALLDARRQLVSNQTNVLSVTAPVQVNNTLGERLIAMLYHVLRLFRAVGLL